MALRSDGLVFAAGYNDTGQLGESSLTSRSTFVQSTGISNAIAVASGYSHTVALRSDGLVFACGANANGQFGDNSVSEPTYLCAGGGAMSDQVDSIGLLPVRGGLF